MGRKKQDHDEQTLEAQWPDALAALSSAAFMEHLRSCRWFGGKAQTLRGLQVLESLPLSPVAQLILLQANYVDAPSETYLLPLQLAAANPEPDSIVARFGGAVLVDALEDEHFRATLLEIITGEQRLCHGSGQLVGSCSAQFKAQIKECAQPLPSRLLKVEQSNSSIIYDDKFFLKLFRRPELGENPDAELLRYFSEGNKFAHAPGYCGVIEYREQGTEPRVLALLVTNVPSEGNAWVSTLKMLERIADQPHEVAENDYLERARRLGQRTAQMHLALASNTKDADFAPEAFSAAYRDSLCQSMAAATRRMMQLLEQKLDALPAKLHSEVADLLRREPEILQRHAGLMSGPMDAQRIRIHGDYHLGQVLDTGSDFTIIDFEGEPATPLKERRSKHSALRDVASMLRSFDYAAHTIVSRAGAEHAARLEAWAENGLERIGQHFVSSYLVTAEGASFLPQNAAQLRMLLDACLLEKAVYEVCYELNNRPAWAAIPLHGITRILACGRTL